MHGHKNSAETGHQSDMVASPTRGQLIERKYLVSLSPFASEKFGIVRQVRPSCLASAPAHSPHTQAAESGV